jgi:hypothetical protein
MGKSAPSSIVPASLRLRDDRSSNRGTPATMILAPNSRRCIKQARDDGGRFTLSKEYVVAAIG